MLYCTQEDFCNRTERKCPNMNDIDSLEYAEWKRRKINRDVRNTFLVILAARARPAGDPRSDHRGHS